jgi:DNA (cytosine-5)-methyltransferase 1
LVIDKPFQKYKMSQVKPKLTLKTPQPISKKAISLFSGAGGDTLGLHRAGWDVVAFSESNRAAIATHLAAFPQSQLLQYEGHTDIRRIPDHVFKAYEGQIGLIFAGFPCQGFSHAGKKRENDPRNEMVYEFARVVECVRPRWMIGENVPGLLSRQGVDPVTGQRDSVIEIIRRIFLNIGYYLTWKVVNATSYGVPQARSRLIIIGSPIPYPHYDWSDSSSRVDSKCNLTSILQPVLTGAVEYDKTRGIGDHKQGSYWVTTTQTEVTGTPHPNLVRLAQGIRNLSSREAAEAVESKSGPIVVHEGLISFGSRASSYHGEVVDSRKPSKTIICSYGLCPRLFVGLHNPTVDRYWIRVFTISELAQIQGFPADYPFKGSDKEIVTQIGNAIPPQIVTSIAGNLGKVVFKSVAQTTD